MNKPLMNKPLMNNPIMSNPIMNTSMNTPIHRPVNTLRVAGFLDHSVVNGEGLRSVIFLSGCFHNCPGCHNEALQDFNYGETLPIPKLMHRIQKNAPITSGVTLSGGEPFEQVEGLSILLKQLKACNLSVWVYTGYVYEELAADPLRASLLSNIDVLVDGRYIEALRDETLKFRGSSNQRILKLEAGKIAALLHDSTHPLKKSI